MSSSSKPSCSNAGKMLADYALNEMSMKRNQVNVLGSSISFPCRRKMNGTYQAHNGPLDPLSRKSKEGAEKLVLYIVWSKHGPIYVFVYTGWSDSPRGRISAERSKISKGILAFSRRIPRKRPPRPAPAMSTRGGLSVTRGGKSLTLDPVERGSVFVVLSNEALMLELA